MNRRELIKAGLAMPLAALVGLPEVGKAKTKGQTVEQERALCQWLKDTMEKQSKEPPVGWEITIPVIRHEGTYGHFCRTIEVPPDPASPKWRAHRIVRPLEQTITLIGAWVTYSQWWAIVNKPARLELHDVTYIGWYMDADTTGYAPSDVGCKGDFTFRIVHESH